LKRIIRTYEQMPNPKYIVGFGSCTINGGIYWNSYATVNKLDRFIPVDMNISGCMPRPQAILHSFNKLFDMIQNGEAIGWKKYEKNYKWYKKNQDAVLKKTAPVLK
ncbi:MAG: NADH-quinone oxidoreductase subunit B, partial [Actinomycetia bacterium]|nr:NADH-quinone oxidoreductase subunit B [Actinomycetes bacterium]